MMYLFLIPVFTGVFNVTRRTKLDPLLYVSKIFIFLVIIYVY